MYKCLDLDQYSLYTAIGNIKNYSVKKIITGIKAKHILWLQGYVIKMVTRIVRASKKKLDFLEDMYTKLSPTPTSAHLPEKNKK